MDEAQAARLAALIDSIDATVASRPDLLLSIEGQAIGMIVSAHRSKGGDWLYGQVLGFGRLIDTIRGWVDRGDGDPADVVRSILG